MILSSLWVWLSNLKFSLFFVYLSASLYVSHDSFSRLYADSLTSNQLTTINHSTEYWILLVTQLVEKERSIVHRRVLTKMKGTLLFSKYSRVSAIKEDGLPKECYFLSEETENTCGNYFQFFVTWLERVTLAALLLFRVFLFCFHVENPGIVSGRVTDCNPTSLRACNAEDTQIRSGTDVNCIRKSMSYEFCVLLFP